MRCHRYPLPIPLDEGVREYDLGGKRLAFEVPDLRGAANHNRRVTINLHPFSRLTEN
jgi:hypothetical protein